MKIIFVILALISVPIITNAQKDVTVPETTSFDTGVGTGSSVNQSNGKLNIALNLVSLKGYKDLSASFSIAYDGANVTKNSRASNEFIPTGVLGMGWGLSSSKILVDNKLTAVRDDDDFYMLDGGGLTPLIAESQNSTLITFRSKQFKPRIIKYYPIQEKWEITKENGYKYTYANVDWSLYWNNWIGNSNQAGASKQGTSWNLTKVEDPFGVSVQYEYLNIEQSLKNSGSVKHTEATYLSKIIDPCGGEIRLIYQDKQANEFFEPNINQIEPDAYQEIYERKYLKWVEAYGTDQNLLYKYRLDYDLIGSGEFTKRFLTNITLINASGESQLFRKFEYEVNGYSEFYGALLHQTLPTQGRISYQYQVNEIPTKQITEEFNFYNSNYIVQGNYIYRGGMMYTWTGSRWEKQSLTFGSNQLQIVYRDNYIAALWLEQNSSSNPKYKCKAYALKDDGYTWEVVSGFHYPGPLGVEDFPPLLISGNNFFAIGHHNRERLQLYRWSGSQWYTDIVGNDSPGKYYYTAANNYVLTHNKNTSPDIVKLYYYDLTKSLQSKYFTNLNLETSGSGDYHSFWYGQNSFAHVNANANPEFILHWDENYSFPNLVNAAGTFPDDITTYGFYNNYFAFSENLEWSSFSFAKVLRYVGDENWVSTTNLTAPFINDQVISGFTQDAFVYPLSFHDQHSIHISIFNANTGIWNNFQKTNNAGGTARKIMAYDFIGNNYAFANSRLYRINNDLSITTLGSYNYNTILSKSDGRNLLYISSKNENDLNGAAFAKILSLTSQNQISALNVPNGFYLKKNPSDKFPKHAIGNGTIVVENKDINNAIKILKFIDGEITTNSMGEPVYKDVVVVKETYDPVLTRKTRNFFCYSNPKISNDNSKVYYSQVAVQNDMDGILGRTVTFYETGTEDVRKTGLPLKIQVFNAQEELVSEQINHWKFYGEYSDTYYINLEKKTTRAIEGDKVLISEQEYDYDFETGLLKETTMRDSEGTIETTTNTYFYEEYPAESATYNILTPIVYSRSFSKKGSNPIVYKNATAITYNNSGVPTPRNSYSWNGEGGGVSSIFDFDGSNPNFRIGQRMTRYDSYGNLLEEKNRSEVITSYLYGYNNKRLVAKIEGASYNSASSIVNQTILNNPTSDIQLRNHLNVLRDNLPNAFVTTYTYNPSIGMTSVTDPRGRTLEYIYDNFYRLDHVKDNEGFIIKKNNYQYRVQPFVFTTETVDLPNCELINSTVGSDPTNQEPLAITVSISAGASNEAVTFKAVASDGGLYSYTWHYSFSPSSQAQYFVISESGNTLTVENPYCKEAIIYVHVEMDYIDPATGNNLLSNTEHKEFTDQECFPK